MMVTKSLKTWQPLPTSDEVRVTEIVDEADLSTCLAPLLGDEANIACVAIAKVGSQNLK